MKDIKYYLQLYKAFLKNTLAREMDYRASFIGDFVDSIINFGITILMFDILYSNVNVIEGWSRYETLFLVGYAQLITAFIFMLFMNNLPRIQKYVSNGDLDLVLIKPCDSQFYVSLRYFYFGGMSSLLPSLILLLYSYLNIKPEISFDIVIIFVVSLICSITIAYSIWLILMTLSFFFIKISQLHEIFLSILKFMEYPSSIYKGLIRLIFVFVIPIISISNIPVEYILGKKAIQNVVILFVIAVVFALMARAFWKYSLRKYQSASN